MKRREVFTKSTQIAATAPLLSFMKTFASENESTRPFAYHSNNLNQLFFFNDSFEVIQSIEDNEYFNVNNEKILFQSDNLTYVHKPLNDSKDTFLTYIHIQDDESLDYYFLKYDANCSAHLLGKISTNDTRIENCEFVCYLKENVVLFQNQKSGWISVISLNSDGTFQKISNDTDTYISTPFAQSDIKKLDLNFTLGENEFYYFYSSQENEEFVYELQLDSKGTFLVQKINSDFFKETQLSSNSLMMSLPGENSNAQKMIYVNSLGEFGSFLVFKEDLSSLQFEKCATSIFQVPFKNYKYIQLFPVNHGFLLCVDASSKVFISSIQENNAIPDSLIPLQMSSDFQDFFEKNDLSHIGIQLGSKKSLRATAQDLSFDINFVHISKQDEISYLKAHLEMNCQNHLANLLSLSQTSLLNLSSHFHNSKFNLKGRKGQRKKAALQKQLESTETEPTFEVQQTVFSQVSDQNAEANMSIVEKFRNAFKKGDTFTTAIRVEDTLISDIYDDVFKTIDHVPFPVNIGLVEALKIICEDLKTNSTKRSLVFVTSNDTMTKTELQDLLRTCGLEINLKSNEFLIVSEAECESKSLKTILVDKGIVKPETIVYSIADSHVREEEQTSINIFIAKREIMFTVDGSVEQTEMDKAHPEDARGILDSIFSVASMFNPLNWLWKA